MIVIQVFKNLQSNIIYFLQSTFVCCNVIVLLSINDAIQSPQFLGIIWRMMIELLSYLSLDGGAVAP